MTHKLRHKIVYEIVWLVGIIMISAAIEYAIIELFDLHPILSVKIQGFIGLLIIAYGIRMIARMGKKGMIVFVDDDEHSHHGNNEK
jgi:hypothetical protein